MEKQKQVAKGTRSGYRKAERYEILERCIGVVFTRHKDAAATTKNKDLFDIELAAHCALQTALCSVFLRDSSTLKGNRQTTRMFDGIKPTIAELQEEIAQQLWRQMYYKLIEANFSKWFNTKHSQAKGEGAANASTFYTHNRLDKEIENFKEFCSSDERSKAFEFQSWTYREQEVIGSWLLSLVSETGLFIKTQSRRSSREKTLSLSENGKAYVDTLKQQADEIVCGALPMIVPPVDMTRETLGGWIGDAAVLNTPTNKSWKGNVELSDLHLKFYNHQQQQSFKINPFVWEIIKELNGRNEQLGKFKAYLPQRLMTMYEELGIPSFQWNNCESLAEQNALIRNHPKFKETKRARSKRYREQQDKRALGLPSKYLYEMIENCINYDNLYIPIEPDFRSRFTCRTGFLSYQGNDVARGVLLFSHEHPIDSDTKRYLSIHLANQAGFDKETYSKRIDWVESHLDVIQEVALMMTGDDAFKNGVALLQEFAKDDEFKFAAACREYYEIFIAESKTTTSLPCAVDATCSGQQLIAGYLKSGELAERVNVLPTNTPGDIYRDTMDKMLELIADDEASLSRSTIRTLKGSIGRKMSKKGFMSGQYGSGTKRQLEDMFGYINNDTDVKLTPSDTLLIKKYWAIALEDICKIRVVFNWFKDLVVELHELGRTSVVIPTPTGTKIYQKYPVPKTKRIETFSFGSSHYRTSTTKELVSSDKANLGKWKTATAANTIHSSDASLLCLALNDFQHSFYCIHDSVSSHAGKPMRDLQNRLKQAYIEVIHFDLWSEIRRANGLPEDVSKLPALGDDLDVRKIMDSEYLFC